MTIVVHFTWSTPDRRGYWEIPHEDLPEFVRRALTAAVMGDMARWVRYRHSPIIPYINDRTVVVALSPSVQLGAVTAVVRVPRAGGGVTCVDLDQDELLAPGFWAALVAVDESAALI
jgi:hypothetical protein